MAVTPPATVQRRLSSLPTLPGVYLWKDKTGAVLYVGKAKKLRTRVRQYFSQDAHWSPRHQMLLRHIADLETIVVENESQALLLENNLIKEHQPRFNIKLRDDKSYPRIAVTLAEDFPRVLVVRRLNIKGARYFGPYTDVSKLRRTLRIIRRIFTVRSCSYKLLKEQPDRPCLDYHIRRCLAPCVGYQGRQNYREMISEVIGFLEGKTVDVRANLRSRMELAAEDLEFERAADIRNSLQWLEQLETRQSVELVGGGNADVIGFARDGEDAVGVIVRVRNGKVLARDHRFLANIAEETDEVVLTAFIVRFYVPADQRADSVILPFVPSDVDQVQELIPKATLIVPQRGVNHRLLALADQNARHLLESLKIESFETDERAEDPVYALGRDLGLTTVPRSLVCIDISTNQGKDTVGSLVWFQAGRPRKNEYRRFKIKGEDAQQDDFAAIHEVVTRFTRRRLEEKKPLPDLMVIDGGRGQLNAAHAALVAVGLESLPLASLAKREEEIFLPDRPESLRLSKRAPSLKLLQRARDEAHRFAVEFNRKRRSKRIITSELMNISGVGPQKRRALLEHFGSLAGVRRATVAEIVSLSGFSERLADRVLHHVRK